MTYASIKDEPRHYIRVTPFGRFAEVARANLAMMEEFEMKIPPEVPFSGEDGSPEWEAWMLRQHDASPLEEKVAQHGAITIVCACAAAEFYINDAAARLLGDTYFENHVDRLELLSKWVLVPRLATGHQLDRGGQAYERLKALAGARNDLMHPKSRDGSGEGVITAMSKKNRIAESARQAVEALDLLRPEAKAFDPHGVHDFNL